MNSRWDVYYDLFVTTFGSCFLWTYSYVRARNLTWIGLTCWSLFVKILEDVAVSLAGTTSWELQPCTVDVRGVSTRVFIMASLKIAAERSMWKNIYIFLPLHNKLGMYIYIYPIQCDFIGGMVFCTKWFVRNDEMELHNLSMVTTKYIGQFELCG